MPTTLALIGAGNIGAGIARLAVAAGLDVVLSNTDPATLADLVAELGPRARATTPDEAAAAGDVVVLAVPFPAYAHLPVEALQGKPVLDAMNYYPDLSGRVEAMETSGLPSSVLVAQHLAGAHVVKAANTLDFVRLPGLARPAGSPDRSAMAIAGDDAAAKSRATELLDALGYDVVDAGSLAESWRLEPGTPVYVSPYLPVQPEGLSPEEAGQWFFSVPGVPRDRATIAALVGSAVRVPAGSVTAGLA